MNTQIRELAEKTITRFDQDMDGSLQPEEFGQWVLADDLQKFAELIVRECMNTIATSNESRQTAYYYRNLVAEHFGVDK